MNTITSILDQLLVIQDRDRKIVKLNQERKDIPARKKHIESRLDTHRERLRSAQENVKKHHLTLKELDGEVEAKKQKIAKLRAHQFEVKTNEEYRTLDREIGALGQEIDQIEERELGIMEEIETLRQAIAQHEKDLKKEEELATQDLKALDQRTANLQEEIDRLSADRQQRAAETDPEWLVRYEKIFNHTHDYALVGIENKACGGCHMKLPPHVIHSVRGGMSMTFCNFCGRMLCSKS